MRALLLLALIVLPAAPAAGPDVETFYRRLVDFDRKYNRLVSTLCAWPDQIGAGGAVCRPADGHLNVKEFVLAREAAKELFGLREPLTEVK